MEKIDFSLLVVFKSFLKSELQRLDSKYHPEWVTTYVWVFGWFVLRKATLGCIVFSELKDFTVNVLIYT